MKKDRGSFWMVLAACMLPIGFICSVLAGFIENRAAEIILSVLAGIAWIGGLTIIAVVALRTPNKPISQKTKDEMDPLDRRETGYFGK